MKFNEQGLIPAVAQDSVTGEILMVAYMNQESLRLTLESKHAWFYSRSRQELWHKGATSGSFLLVERVLTDCDADTILLLVRPMGPACHTGERSCFFREVTGPEPEVGPASVGFVSSGVAERLFNDLADRQKSRPEGSYVASLMEKDVDEIGREVGEEAAEVSRSAANDDATALVGAAADLWLHSLVLLARAGVPAARIWAELERRHE